MLISIENPFASREACQVPRKAPLESRGIQCPPQNLCLGGESPRLTFDAADNFQKLLLIEALKIEVLLITKFSPTTQIWPLQVRNRHRNTLQRHRLDQHRIDLAKMLERHRHLVATHPGIPRRVDGKKRYGHLRIVNPTGDRSLPVIPRPDLLVINPHLVPPRL